MLKKDFRKIVLEVKLNIVRDLLNEIHEYDSRFDVNHMIHLDDIITQVMLSKISDTFINDLAMQATKHDFEMLRTEIENIIESIDNTSFDSHVRNEIIDLCEHIDDISNKLQ